MSEKAFKNYKFRDLKVYGSDEWMAESTKKYRTVYDREETDYIRVEFSFFNKLFDEEEWEVNALLKCFSLDGEKRTELCSLETKRIIKTDENIVYLRDGWGNATLGTFWKRGDYLWEAYIDNELVGSRKFYVEEVGRVTKDSNPYFEIDSVRMYEGDENENKNTSKKYLKEFSRKDSKYIWVELNIRVKTEKDYFCEVFFNFFDDARQPKGQDSRVNYVKKGSQDQIVTFHAGWGRATPGIWKDEKYTVELVFMDTLIAIVPFTTTEDQFTEGDPEIIFTLDQALEAGAAKTSKPAANTASEPASLEDALKELDSLTGLEEIKTEIRKNINYLNFIKIRKEKGFEDNSKISLHSVFTGNPGTGKTTVVRLLGKIYKSMGLLSKGHVKEVDRSDLVAQYIGQTAPRVKKVIEEARGGILFVDEAYALTRGKDDSNDFGKEVIEILLKEMSDGKGDIAIMYAGYPKEMENFTASNPGIRSRISYYYHFPDYLPEELVSIADSAAVKNHLSLNEECREILKQYFTEAYRSRDKTFGNARFANAVITEAKMNMGIRLMAHPDLNSLAPEELSLLLPNDIHQVFAGKGKKELKLKIDERALKDSLDELNELVGLTGIKEEINELVKLVRFYQETGRDILNKFSLHSVFTGNPGTGKTTVARIIAKIYRGLGILERGHLVEVDREGLVAGYVGQTAIKTSERINDAMGGILFIDEAYGLSPSRSSSNDFGQEAIQVILKRMEDNRGQFGVIVAGYTQNMQEFIESNPGLKSRFDRTFHFEDYVPEDMMRIALSMLSRERLQPDPAAREHLENYFSALYENRDKHFGNARVVRQVIGAGVKKQHLRMATLEAAQRTPEVLGTLTYDDVDEFIIPETKGKGSKLGFQY